jgi:hypothetical protein
MRATRHASLRPVLIASGAAVLYAAAVIGAYTLAPGLGAVVFVAVPVGSVFLREWHLRREAEALRRERLRAAAWLERNSGTHTDHVHIATRRPHS